LKNLEDRRGRPARLVPGDPLPEESEVLPGVGALQCCSIETEVGVTAPLQRFASIQKEPKRPAETSPIIEVEV